MPPAGLLTLVSVLAALCVVMLGEALQVAASDAPALPALLSTLPLTAYALQGPLLGEALRVISAWLTRGRARLAAECSVAAAQAAWAYAMLAEYEPFAGLPCMAGAAALGLGLAMLGASSFWTSLAPRTKQRLGWAGLLAGLVLAYVNYTAFPGAYPTLHHTLLDVTLCVNARAIALLAGAATRRAAEVALLGLLGAFAVAIGFGRDSDVGRTHGAARALTVGGQVRTVAHHRKVAAAVGHLEAPCRSAPAALTEEEALQELVRYTELPGGQASWGGRFNLLLVTVEALRADDAGLSGGTVLMPRVKAFVEESGVVYDRGYSPTPTTVQTMAALQRLAPVSQASLQVEGDRAWRGQLRDGAGTFIEALQRDGYSTWASVHPGGFGGNWLAPAQGIGQLRRAAADDGPTLDAKIVDEATSLIEQANPKQPWFGWVFLASPHAPYLGRGGLTETSPVRDRYRSEISYVDEQLGRLFDRLSELGQLERTLVLVTGDHGETFGEHGTTHHSSHLFEESIHVPLAVRWPGMTGRRVARPVVSIEVLAAMLVAGPPETAAFARAAARDHLIPTRRAAGGAAVTELLSLSRMWVALADDEHKLVSHLSYETVQLFDLRTDPNERDDLLVRDAELAKEWRARLADLLALRACKADYRMTFPTTQ